MKIIKADKTQKHAVLKLLDDFRTECHRIIHPNGSKEKFYPSMAQDKGGSLFEKIVDSSTSAIFLAEENGKFIGICTVNAVPQIRHGAYVGEIEEMFVYPDHQGTGVALKLMEAVESWAKQHDIHFLRLESGNELLRAHGFYEKMKFRHYARAYEKNID